jgi:hypothetical protein
MQTECRSYLCRLSPSPCPKNPLHFKSFFEEMHRAMQGLPGAKPDEFLQRPRTEAKSKQNSLFPSHTHCPHYRCWSFGLRTCQDADNHESAMHPDQRAQRLYDARAASSGKAAPERKFSCSFPGCTLAFSTKNMLKLHAEAWDHESKATNMEISNKLKRKAAPFIRPQAKVAAASGPPKKRKVSHQSNTVSSLPPVPALRKVASV